MTRQAALVSAKLPPLAAQAIVGNVQTAASAGSGQSDATKVTATNVQVTSGSGGIVLPVSNPGDKFFIFNVSGSNCSIYPPSGAAINALSANSALTIATTKSCVLVFLTATQIRSIPLVPS